MKKSVIKYVTVTGNNRQCKPDSEKAKELHTCPYREEIAGDYLTLCDCDENQQQQCAEDI